MLELLLWTLLLIDRVHLLPDTLLSGEECLSFSMSVNLTEAPPVLVVSISPLYSSVWTSPSESCSWCLRTYFSAYNEHNYVHLYTIHVWQTSCPLCTCTCTVVCTTCVILRSTDNTYMYVYMYKGFFFCCIFSTFLELKCFALGLVTVFFFLKWGCSRSPLSTVSGGLCSIQFSDKDLFLAPLLLYRGGFYNDREREREVKENIVKLPIMDTLR